MSHPLDPSFAFALVAADIAVPTLSVLHRDHRPRRRLQCVCVRRVPVHLRTVTGPLVDLPSHHHRVFAPQPQQFGRGLRVRDVRCVMCGGVRMQMTGREDATHARARTQRVEPWLCCGMAFSAPTTALQAPRMAPWEVQTEKGECGCCALRNGMGARAVCTSAILAAVPLSLPVFALLAALDLRAIGHDDEGGTAATE